MAKLERAQFIDFAMSGRKKGEHTGDRPYACTTSGKDFAQSDTLKRHRAQVHAVDQE